ncbi:MAG: Maf family protein [Thermoleophilaceae bacterium]
MRPSGPDRDGRSSEVILVLASASPQRRAILEQLGVEFTVRAADVEERRHGDPERLVFDNALLKARAVRGSRVLGADTAVAVDGDVLGKPAGEVEARAFIERLSGREHLVWSGVALTEEGTERTAVDSARVRFRHLGKGDVDWYLSTGEWRGRAGGYAIQGRGGALVEAIEGDYNCVVGLPVAALVRLAPSLIVRCPCPPKAG